MLAEPMQSPIAIQQLFSALPSAATWDMPEPALLPGSISPFLSELPLLQSPDRGLQQYQPIAELPNPTAEAPTYEELQQTVENQSADISRLTMQLLQANSATQLPYSLVVHEKV